MQRRSFLAIPAAAAASLALPGVARGASSRVLKFIPEGDLPVLDPVFTTATVTRNHGYMVFDTLYGQDAEYGAQPQMVAGHTVEDDGRLWTLTLRDGLRFHDGEPVRAQDVVPSIMRFAARDAFGRALMDATDEISAASDRTVRFRLKRPFPLLPAALGKSGTGMPCIMPERLAKTDPNTQVTEMVGSGPYRFVPGERIAGARIVYEKFTGYVPRPDGPSALTAGPKIAHFERVEWHVVPDSGTAANALVSDEVDWWQNAAYDLLEVVGRRATVANSDPTGQIGILRFNHLHPPFDNAAIRRALLGAVDQSDFMTAVAGSHRDMWRDQVAVFSPGSPLDSPAGKEVLAGRRDLGKVKRELEAAGYRGERIVVLDATDYPGQHAMAAVAIDLLKQLGMNLDIQASDWGTVVQRRASRQPPDKGGWNIFFTNLTGANNLTPAAHLGIRGNGEKAWFGWPTAPKLEALRDAWFAARDFAEQKRICEQIQRQFFEDVPYLPLGAVYQPTAYSRTLKDVRVGFPMFFGVKRA